MIVGGRRCALAPPYARTPAQAKLGDLDFIFVRANVVAFVFSHRMHARARLALQASQACMRCEKTKAKISSTGEWRRVARLKMRHK